MSQWLDQKKVCSKIGKKVLEYKWLNTADLIQKALEAGEDTGCSIPESWNKVAYCYNMASRQARDIEEFRKLRQLAIENYEKAAELFGKLQKTVGAKGGGSPSAASGRLDTTITLEHIIKILNQ